MSGFIMIIVHLFISYGFSVLWFRLVIVLFNFVIVLVS